MLTKKAGAYAIVAIIVSAHIGFSQTAARNPLAEIKNLKCRFPVYSTGSWKDGEPRAEVRQPQDLSLVFEEIDTEGGTARVNASSGAVYITAFLTSASLHLMERTVSGTLNITTIFAPQGDGGKLRAVHSRHAFLQLSIPGVVSEPAVSQNYGTCEPGR